MNLLKTETIHGFTFTRDPQGKYEKDYAPELAIEIEILHNESQHKVKNKTIDRLKVLIEKYPTVPQLKNFLSVAYERQGKREKAFEITTLICKEHPDYLYGKLNIANEFIVKGETSKVLQILGEDLDLKKLYPQRDIFHITEITSFFKTLILYYLALEDLDTASEKFNLLQDIAPDTEETQFMQQLVDNAVLRKALDRLSNLEEDRISPIVKGKEFEIGYTTPPIFHHKEMELLFENDLTIPAEKLRAILDLPKETLAEDLRNILLDAELRYDYFLNADIDADKLFFPIHALFILMEIGDTESLDAIFNFLENDSEFLEFWLGDHITENLWRVFYKLGINEIPRLTKFLIKPGIGAYSKAAITNGLCQITLHHPEKRKEVISAFYEVFQAFNNATLEDNLIDSEFLGLAVCETINCMLPELLPLIKPLYEKNYVSILACGDYEEVEEAFHEEINYDYLEEIVSIFEIYSKYTVDWEESEREEEDRLDDKEFDNYEEIPEQAASEKINRNDPCPCGSGKKHKKCCWKG